ncbi:RNA polymerase sigma factor [Candidatus Neomarinimicrobiota bacterium]
MTVPEEVIVQSINGDQRAFQCLVESYQSQAYALAMRFLRDENEAQDVVQESFIRVWKHLHSFDTDRNFGTWLYKIVTNCCLDHLKALRRWRRMFRFFEREEENSVELPGTGSVENEAHNRDLSRIIHKLVAILPRKQGTVFTLRDLQNLSVDEVAEVTGLSPGSVKTNLHYARRTIRKKLHQTYNVEELWT